MPVEFEPLVGSFEHLTDKSRSAEALKTLQKIASLVKPIMRTRGWKVGALAEFYPDERNLLGLNINRGQKILLRLRHAGDSSQFLPVEEVTDTMLHELSHIIHGPHDEQFHNLWNQLRDEHEALIRKGYTGEGFLSDGRMLGGNRIPMHEARRKARAAAEKRRNLTAGSGQRLGGGGIARGMDVRKTIADAAQRRINATKNINRGCASGTSIGQEIAKVAGNDRRPGVTMTKAREDDANERAIMEAFIEMIQEEERQKYGAEYLPPSQKNPAGMRATLSPEPSSSSLLNTTTEGSRNPSSAPSDPPRIARQPQPSPFVAPAEEVDTWACEICTLVNPLIYLTCDACGTERPASVSSNRSTITPSTGLNGHQRIGKGSPRETPNSLNPRMNAVDSLARLRAQENAKPQKPMGWTCIGCRNWMESQWWTCSVCGSMKVSS